MTSIDRRIYPYFPLSKCSYIGKGGIVDAKIDIYSLKGAKKTIKEAYDINYQLMYIGNGSNVVYLDKYILPTIAVALKACNYVIENDVLLVEVGINLSSLAKKMSDLGYANWTAFEDIPGTLGGAITNNAGAFSQTISDYLIDIILVDKMGNVVTYSREELNFSYRSSLLKKDKRGLIYLASFRLLKKEKDLINQERIEYHQKRLLSQPQGILTLGSTFKNGHDYFAAYLIEQSGLKGYHKGHLSISEKHANFLIFQKGVTMREIRDFIAYIQNIVYNKYTILLELEIEIQGGESDGGRAIIDKCQ